MKFKILILILCIWSCGNKNELRKYFDAKQSDELLTNIVTYVFEKAPYATNHTRFNKEFRPFYEKYASQFKIEKIALEEDGYYYFFLIRPVSTSDKYKRGVIGKFKLEGKSMMPKDFEEIAITPHLTEEEVKERGEFLYNELRRNGNLNQFIEMKHYVEWPDKYLEYNKNLHEWVRTDEAKS